MNRPLARGTFTAALGPDQHREERRGPLRLDRKARPLL